MNRRVERKSLDRWIMQNRPDGLFKLAQKCGVAAGTLDKVRRGYLPKRQQTRDAICEALGVPEDVLFPIAGNSGEEAS
jgi:transcriptional regulator with XRE-family HTH domain